MYTNKLKIKSSAVNAQAVSARSLRLSDNQFHIAGPATEKVSSCRAYIEPGLPGITEVNNIWRKFETDFGKLLTHAFLSPSCVIWYWAKDGDDLHLGR